MRVFNSSTAQDLVAYRASLTTPFAALATGKRISTRGAAETEKWLVRAG